MMSDKMVTLPSYRRPLSLENQNELPISFSAKSIRSSSYRVTNQTSLRKSGRVGRQAIWPDQERIDSTLTKIGYFLLKIIWETVDLTTTRFAGFITSPPR